jgi:endoglycosylceramidase
MSIFNGKHHTRIAGRVMIFHGVNAVYKLKPWHPTITGPVNVNSSLNPQDMAQLREWGFNAVRLGMQWEGAEYNSTHAPGVFNATYLSFMRNLVDTLGTFGIYSIADMHQDVLSLHYCGFVRTLQ